MTPLDKDFFYVLLRELKVLELNVDDVRGQSYDNRANMKGKNKECKENF